MMHPRPLQPYLSEAPIRAEILKIQPKTGQGGGRFPLQQRETLSNTSHVPPQTPPTFITSWQLPQQTHSHRCPRSSRRGETPNCTSLAMHAMKGKSASRVMMNRVLEVLLHLIQVPNSFGTLWWSKTKAQCAHHLPGTAQPAPEREVLLHRISWT